MLNTLFKVYFKYNKNKVVLINHPIYFIKLSVKIFNHLVWMA